jgi:hypothetical protein
VHLTATADAAAVHPTATADAADMHPTAAAADMYSTTAAVHPNAARPPGEGRGCNC